MPEPHDLRHILDYLQGRIGDAERGAFSDAIEADALLADRVELVRELAGAMAAGALPVPVAETGACPTRGELELYCSGGLAGNALERLELHLALCDRCRRSVFASRVAAVEALRPSPEGRADDFCASWNDVAVERHAAGDIDGAMEALSEAQDCDPRRPEVLYNRGRMLAALGLPHMAELSLSRYLELAARDDAESGWAAQARATLDSLSAR